MRGFAREQTVRQIIGCLLCRAEFENFLVCYSVTKEQANQPVGRLLGFFFFFL